MIVFIYSICREIPFPCRPFHGYIRPINAPVSLSCLQFTPLRRTQEPPTALLCLGRGYQTGHWAPAPFLERWTWPNGQKISIIGSCFHLVCMHQTQMCSVLHFPYLQTAQSHVFFPSISENGNHLFLRACLWKSSC